MCHLRYPEEWFLCASHQFSDSSIFPWSFSGTINNTTNEHPSTHRSNAKQIHSPVWKRHYCGRVEDDETKKDNNDWPEATLAVNVWLLTSAFQRTLYFHSNTSNFFITAVSLAHDLEKHICIFEKNIIIIIQVNRWCIYSLLTIRIFSFLTE